MKSLIAIPVFGPLAIIGAAFLSPQEANQVSVKAVAPYTCDRGTIEIVGVCGGNEAGVQCWGPDGKPKPDMTERCDGAFRAGRIVLEVKHKSKFRIVVIRTSGKRIGDGSFGYNFTCKSPSRTSIFYEDLFRYTSGDSEKWTTLAVSYPKSATTAEVSTELSMTMDPSPPLPLVKGRKIIYAGAQFEVARVGTVWVDSLPNSGYYGRLWMIGLRSGQIDRNRVYLTWKVIGKDGSPVKAVDAEGRPAFVDPSKVRSGTSQTSQKWDYFAATCTASYQPTAAEGEVFLSTNVNPELIRELTCVGASRTTLTITDIPLDPVVK